MTATLVGTKRCKAGSKAECQREATVAIHAVRNLPATEFGPAQVVVVAVQSCAVHARRIGVGQKVTGIGEVTSVESL